MMPCTQLSSLVTAMSVMGCMPCTVLCYDPDLAEERLLDNVILTCVNKEFQSWTKFGITDLFFSIHLHGYINFSFN